MRSGFVVIERPDLADVVGTQTPVDASLPRLALPDRDGGLERVDAEAGVVEGLATMRRAGDDDDRALPQLEDPDAVEQRDAAGVGPVAADVGGDGGQPRLDLLGVRLVLQRRDAGATLGVVA